MIRRNSGFTIIEVTLFLAISGALAVGLFAASSVAIQRQQYKDAVQSYAGYLRDEYARVISVQNDRGDDLSCPVSGSESGSVARGQSSCVIVGRYIVTENKGTEYKSYPIYANSVSTGGSEISWNYMYDENQESTYSLTWDVKTRFASNSSGANFSFIFYRNPDTGRISVQSSTAVYPSAKVGDMISDVSADATSSREICVYDTGWLQSERQSVFLSERAGSSDAVTVANATDGCND